MKIIILGNGNFFTKNNFINSGEFIKGFIAMSLTAFFHGNDFSAYDNIPTSWKDIPQTYARDSLGNAVIKEMEKDSFTRIAQQKASEVISVSKETVNSASQCVQGAQEAGEAVVKTGIFAKAGAGLKSLGKALSAHKGITAVVAAAALITGGLTIKDIKNKKKIKQENQIKNSNSNRRKIYNA